MQIRLNLITTGVTLQERMKLPALGFKNWEEHFFFFPCFQLAGNYTGSVSSSSLGLGEGKNKINRESRGFCLKHCPILHHFSSAAQVWFICYFWADFSSLNRNTAISLLGNDQQKNKKILFKTALIMSHKNLFPLLLLHNFLPNLGAGDGTGRTSHLAGK